MAKLEIKQFFQSAMAGEVDYSPTKALIGKFLLIPELDEGANASTNFKTNPVLLKSIYLVDLETKMLAKHILP